MFDIGVRVRIKFGAEVYADGVNISEDETGIVTMMEDETFVFVDWDGVGGWVDTSHLEVV